MRTRPAPAATPLHHRSHTFYAVWAGQLLSVVGSGLTSFALGIWVLQQTGSVTSFALITLTMTLPGILVAPAAGAYIDRWDRRVVMLGADLIAGLATAGVAALYVTGALAVWHIYINAAVISLTRAFQEPAYMASVPTLVPADRLSRANGLVGLGDALGTLISPALAGVLLVTVGLGGVILVDVATFLVAVGTLAFVRFPRVVGESVAGIQQRIVEEVRTGWTYLRSRQGMIGLLVVFAGVNFFLSFAMVLYVPLLLAFTSEQVLGVVISVGGFGMLAGSILMSTWEGPRSKILGLIVPIAVGGVALGTAGLAPSPALVAVSVFVLFFLVPIANTSSQTLWQTRIPLDLQGRAFAVRRVFAQSATPLGYLLAGPLADRVFEPWLADGGALADTVGAIIGTGDGRGIGFLFMVTGVATAAMALASWLYEPIRNLERHHPNLMSEDALPAV